MESRASSMFVGSGEVAGLGGSQIVDALGEGREW